MFHLTWAYEPRIVAWP